MKGANEYLEVEKLSTSCKEKIRLLWNEEYPIAIQHKSLEDFDEYVSIYVIYVVFYGSIHSMYVKYLYFVLLFYIKY